MTTYRIDRNVAMPERLSRVAEFPWRAMEVGDSFFVPAERAGLYGQRVHQNAANYRRRCKVPVCFTVRKVKGGYRAWRVAP